MQHPSPPAQEKRFFGHPLQLSTLFHIELWERFSFYGMQGILLIYLYYAVKDGGLGIDQGLAGGIVGAYSASVYLATILGGWLADRVLGAERTLFHSGVSSRRRRRRCRRIASSRCWAARPASTADRLPACRCMPTAAVMSIMSRCTSCSSWPRHWGPRSICECAPAVSSVAASR